MPGWGTDGQRGGDEFTICRKRAWLNAASILRSKRYGGHRNHRNVLCGTQHPLIRGIGRKGNVYLCCCLRWGVTMPISDADRQAISARWAELVQAGGRVANGRKASKRPVATSSLAAVYFKSLAG